MGLKCCNFPFPSSIWEIAPFQFLASIHILWSGFATWLSDGLHLKILCTSQKPFSISNSFQFLKWFTFYKAYIKIGTVKLNLVKIAQFITLLHSFWVYRILEFWKDWKFPEQANSKCEFLHSLGILSLSFDFMEKGEICFGWYSPFTLLGLLLWSRMNSRSSISIIWLTSIWKNTKSTKCPSLRSNSNPIPFSLQSGKVAQFFKQIYWIPSHRLSRILYILSNRMQCNLVRKQGNKKNRQNTVWIVGWTRITLNKFSSFAQSKASIQTATKGKKGLLFDGIMGMISWWVRILEKS